VRGGYIYIREEGRERWLVTRDVSRGELLATGILGWGNGQISAGAMASENSRAAAAVNWVSPWRTSG